MSPSADSLDPVNGYSFGPFYFDIQRHLLYKKDKLIQLPPRVLHMLSILVQNHGKDLSKDYLMDQLWPGIAVEENNLTVAMSALRKALGESPGQHMYVVTLPGRGYRFVAKVAERIEGQEIVAQPLLALPRVSESGEGERPLSLSIGERWPNVIGAWMKHRSMGIASAGLLVAILMASLAAFKLRTAEAEQPSAIAVLPFKQTLAHGDDAYLGLGMADALVTRLGAIRQVAVRPISSVLRYYNSPYDPQIVGRSLNVSAVVDGTIERDGDAVRVSVRLLRVSDAHLLWSYEFLGKFPEIFAFQDDIAQQVTQALTLRLDDEEKRHLIKHYTANTEAYQLYLRGRFFWNKRTPESIRRAIGYFQQAVAKDPNFALAYSGLADCYNLSAYYSDIPATEAFPKAEEAAQKALSIDSTLAEAYNSLALVRVDYKWDFAGAEVAYRRAIDLNPEYSTAHQWYAEYLIAMGRQEEARREIRRAQQLDPLSLIDNATMGEIEFFARNYDQASAQLHATLDLDQRFWPAQWFLGWTYEGQGKNREALETLENAQSISPDDAQILSELAYAYAVNGTRQRAEECIKGLEKNPNKLRAYSYTIALVYSALGDKEAAFEWLSRAVQNRSWMLIYAKVDPRMDGLRSDPRFGKILNGVGFGA